MIHTVFAISILFALASPLTAYAIEKSRHVVVIVWDGMRPDFISDERSPALAALARRGVMFRNHHSVFLSSTVVNGTAISTGSYPGHSGIVGNSEYRPDIDPLKPVRTELLDSTRKGDQYSHGRYLRQPTIAEIVRQNGGSTIVAGSKPVVLLADRAPRTSDSEGVNVFAGETLPQSLGPVLTNRHGAFPGEAALEPSRIDWVTTAVIDSLWSKGVPNFSFIWMNEPDLSQHLTGPGSERTLSAIRRADNNLTLILTALESHGVRDETDIIVVSDHGASTVESVVDIADLFTKAGLPAKSEFKSKPAPGEILVVSNSGSTLVYVIGHDEGIIRRAVTFFQQADFCGVIFCKKPLPGTFSFREVGIDCETAPDIFISMRWNTEKSKYGTPGMMSTDVSSFGPGQGSHVTLSPFDMHATLVASGPHFRKGIADTLATGNVDVAPTALWILGIKPPRSMDGRILTESLVIKGPKLNSYEPRRIEATTKEDGRAWSQYLNFTEVNGVRYLDEGNGRQN
jgi:predicted AlkP superfamily pyrophosphatase or phosphodiesterase